MTSIINLRKFDKSFSFLENTATIILYSKRKRKDILKITTEYSGKNRSGFSLGKKYHIHGTHKFSIMT